MAPIADTVEDPSSGAVALWFTADGWVPNNPRLPVIFCRAAVPCPAPDPAAAFERVFRSNGWAPQWRNGVYPFHHYHSTAHEVLGLAPAAAATTDGRCIERNAPPPSPAKREGPSHE